MAHFSFFRTKNHPPELKLTLKSELFSTETSTSAIMYAMIKATRFIWFDAPSKFVSIFVSPPIKFLMIKISTAVQMMYDMMFYIIASLFSFLTKSSNLPNK